MSQAIDAIRPDDVADVRKHLEGQPKARAGFERCFYTLWGRDNPEDRIYEQVPSEDFVGSLVDGTGRQDWRKLRPFDLLPEVDPHAGGVAQRLLYTGEFLRIGCEHVIGTQPLFERAGDYQTIFFQFSGTSLIETSFGSCELHAGEAVLIPAMVAHRTTGSVNCRRMAYYPKDPLNVDMKRDVETTDIGYVMSPAGQHPGDEAVPTPACPPNGKVQERLTHWNGRPEDAYIFQRSYEYLVGKAESGPRPVLVRPFNHFTTPPDSFKLSVRTALLWESGTFRQRVYALPGRQPGPHRGYDEDEFWFQFSGHIQQETEHGSYPMEGGETSMAEAGITHTSTNTPGSLRLTTYTNSPIRMVVDPSEHLRTSHWQIHETVHKGWL